ncbi:MAG: DUF5723 family protein [Polaribacter sp.]|uniref:DUF5723 family protein n=1 Tax=Polaribacter sp. TaxID=1920175 RepID=UPI002F35473B
MLNIKKISILLFVFIGIKNYSQNKQVLYGFAELPQTLMLNPGAETNYKFHAGIPLLSGFSGEFGSTGFVIRDVFDADNRPINDKISEVLNKLDIRDHLEINSQIEVLSGGYRYDDNTYFSFGFYEEIDGIAYFPKDPLTLITEGNAAYLNKSFDLSQILYKLDAFGVLHFGATRKVNENLTIGGRFKIYSSAFNMQSSNNSGTFRTEEGSDNIYRHYLDNIDVNLKTSGLVADNELVKDPGTYLGNTFFGSNLGLGLDFGVTYHFSPQLEFTGSIIDLGFIHHKKNIKNSTAKGSFVFEGLEFEYNSADPTNYWAELDKDFKEKLPSGSNEDSYISWRPTKINAALKYSFGERRSKICYDNTYKDFYKNAIGVQLYSIFRPLSPQLALTGFYEKSFSNKLHAKITYTIDDYSYYNIGAGLSAQIGKINFYGMVDNIAEFSDIASANNISLQLGMNLIF